MVKRRKLTTDERKMTKQGISLLKEGLEEVVPEITSL